MAPQVHSTLSQIFIEYYSEGQRFLMEMRIKKGRAISDPAFAV
jgi:hypothetical protein